MDGPPPPENTKPPYYGTPDTKANNPCNPVAAANTNENWSIGDFIGLDNDGNNRYDTADPACGVPCTYTLTPSNATFAAAGGIGNFRVNTISSCAWTATSQTAWVTITSGSPGNGTGTVNYAVAVNSTTLSRTGRVSVATQTFTVIQAGQCTYTLSATSTNVAASAGSGSFGITAPAGCAWTAVSNDGWISTSSSGSGNGTVSYTFQANTGASGRSGTITVGGQTFTVNQAGVSCSYTLSATSTNVAASAGAGSFGVTALPGCAWTAVSNDGWISTSSSGSGNGTVSYTFQANTGASGRSGTITVGGQTFTVNQAGVQSQIVDLDIAQFHVDKRRSIDRPRPIRIRLVVKNEGMTAGSAMATVVGMQNGIEVYRKSMMVSDPIGGGRTRYDFLPYTSSVVGDIMWVATLADDDPDTDEATATTTVRSRTSNY